MAAETERNAKSQQNNEDSLIKNNYLCQALLWHIRKLSIEKSSGTRK